ncbi:multidrug resistance-associated protein 4-like [Stylophora pistillata]|uniref:multidrug resistance-associated protein 4-like n=1 Tax=Stylophora pistillata TaxID=50429 RepID=UPI000C043B99|nr:multidrug resistance-associated protein 4-like [Stylophora pistillata]
MNNRVEPLNPPNHKLSLSFLVLFLQILNTRHRVLTERTSGYLINLISKDMVPVYEACSNLRSLSAPLGILVVFPFLWIFVGWQTLGGAVFSVVLIVYQTTLGSVFKRLQDKVARLTDKRLRLIYDVISGIRVLKMNAWEWCFYDLVSKVRSLELNIVYKKGVILAGYLSAYSCYPIVSSFLLDFNYNTTGIQTPIYFAIHAPLFFVSLLPFFYPKD